MALTFDSVVKFSNAAIQMKATKKYFPTVLFFKSYNMVVNFDAVDEILTRQFK